MNPSESLYTLFPLFLEVFDPTNDCQLVDTIEIRNISAGCRVFENGQSCEGLPLVIEGSIRVDKVDEPNHTLCLYRLGPGEACVISTSCLLARSRYSVQGTAETDVKLALLPSNLFNELLTRSEFRKFVFGVLSDRMSELMELVDSVAFKHLDQRLARLLLGRGRMIRTTHQQIADELGCLRQVVSRLLRIFAERGWIILTYGNIEIVSPSELRILASE